MSLPFKGLNKLTEECGELVQIAAKKMSYPDRVRHPDGSHIDERLEEELADVLAACETVITLHKLNWARIESRVDVKKDLFLKWSHEK